MGCPELHHDIDRVEACVLGQRHGNHFQGLGEGKDCELLLSRKLLGGLSEPPSNLCLGSTASCHHPRVTDHVANHAESVVHGPLGLVNEAFARFKELADKKKDVFDDDLYAIAREEGPASSYYELMDLAVTSALHGTPHATVTVAVDGEASKVEADGDGVVDACYRAIRQLSGVDARLERYQVKAITGGTDALGDVSCLVRVGDIDGTTDATGLFVAEGVVGPQTVIVKATGMRLMPWMKAECSMSGGALTWMSGSRPSSSPNMTLISRRARLA